MSKDVYLTIFLNKAKTANQQRTRRGPHVLRCKLNEYVVFLDSACSFDTDEATLAFPTLGQRPYIICVHHPNHTNKFQ